MNILRYIDYSLYTDKERVEKVNELLADPLPLNEFELEGLANYILYGKDESKLTNSVPVFLVLVMSIISRMIYLQKL